MVDQEGLQRTALTSQQQADLRAFFNHAGWRYPEPMRKAWVEAMLRGAAKAAAEGPPAPESTPNLSAGGRFKPISTGQVGDTKYTIYG